ncbi:MAG: M28 family peptidase [Flavobacteriales bacterium]|nr:M28 family peptidase [Flavobacteriales bacterium]
MRGLHDPLNYTASDVIDDHAEIICELRSAISADSLKERLMSFLQFGTRNTFSDTASDVTGIGAAQRWAFDRFQQISEANDSRLIPAYIQFDNVDNQGVCGSANGLRNVIAVLPGRSVNEHRTIIIEAHYDSRCTDLCDLECDAPGAEDNGSGSVLVLELARTLLKYTFDNTLVFMLTTGEEQGLLGAKAMAQYCADKDVAIKAVLNNDVVGGIYCGNSSSPPSCPGPGAVDSLNLRIFSNGTAQFMNRGLARSIKLFYEEKLRTEVAVPTTIEVMNMEDRVGRGGDHIPFRQLGFTSVRFTAANEHGTGNPLSPGYTDRQHTSDDILGVDTDGDLVIDSFFVDFNYLQRNTLINGMTATLLALGPEAPEITLADEPTGLRVAIVPPSGCSTFRVAARRVNSPVEFTAVYLTTETSFLIPGLVAGSGYYICAAAIDDNGVTSSFSSELLAVSDADTPEAPMDDLPYGINCSAIGILDHSQPDPSVFMSCFPNPTSSNTTFVVVPLNGGKMEYARIIITDPLGRDLFILPVANRPGRQEVNVERDMEPGMYAYRLELDGRIIATNKLMVLR